MPAIGNRRLQQAVEHERSEARRELFEVLTRVAVLELEPHDDEADAHAKPRRHAIDRRWVGAEERGEVGRRARRRQESERDEAQAESTSEHATG